MEHYTTLEKRQSRNFLAKTIKANRIWSTFSISLPNLQHWPWFSLIEPINFISSVSSLLNLSDFLPSTATRYKRLSAYLLHKCNHIDNLCSLLNLASPICLSGPLVAVAVDESIWKMTHAIDDPAEWIVVIMPRKPAGIGALAYLLSGRLLHSNLPIPIIGIVRLANRNDVTPLRFSRALVIELLEISTIDNVA